MAKQITNQQIYELLQKIQDRLESIETSISSESNDLNVYPARFVGFAEAVQYFSCNSVQGLYAACAQGTFKPGTELIDVSSALSDKPRYLLNVRAYYRRKIKEQKPHVR